MRSFEQREFVPLFQREDERNVHDDRAESATEMSQQMLRLARSIESLTRALLRVIPAGLPFDRTGSTAVVRTISAGPSPDSDA